MHSLSNVTALPEYQIENWINADGIMIDIERTLGEVWVHVQIEKWDKTHVRLFGHYIDACIEHAKTIGMTEVFCMIHEGDRKLKRFAELYSFKPVNKTGTYEIWKREL